MRTRIALCACLVVACHLIVACDTGGGAGAGEEGGPCYGNGTCNPGLTCNLANVCEPEVQDPCEGVTCTGHGSCALLQGAAVCVCEDGYHAEGLQCVEDVVDPCQGVDCSGHGACVLVAGVAACDCATGYHAEGLDCLANDPCLGVECSGHGQCALLAGEPVCVCEAGFHAENLSCVEDDPLDVCLGVTCSGHGTCADVGGVPTCTCEQGYAPAGTACLPVDPCLGVTCSEHGFCADHQGLPVCVCEEGYHDEGLACVANDPVDVCNGVTCSGHGTCQDAGGVPACLCDAGYHAEGTACLLDDPCEGETCSGHGLCALAGGQARCFCDAGYHAEGMACILDPIDPCEGVTCAGHGTCIDAGGAAECDCDAGYHAEELTCVEDPPACFFDLLEDFEDGTVAPWVIVAGDVSVTAGRLRVVRTGDRWGEVSLDLPSAAGGAWTVEADLELLTSQSVVSICLQRVGPPLHMVCLTLNTKTENGSAKGVHLFYDNMVDNVGSPAGSELLELAFDPGVGVSHHLRLTRDSAGLFEVWVEGASIGTVSDNRLDRFDRITLYGMQDTSAGHGGFFDNLDFCAGEPVAVTASSCADASAGDGVYAVDPDGAGPIQALDVYCADVGTAEPRAYLELAVTGGTHNYAYYIYGPTGLSVTCNWTKVRILDLTSMLIDSTDRRFASCSGGLEQGYSKWGIAGSCTAGSEGRMNIDLTGTPFRVNWEGGVNYQPVGWMPSGAITRNEGDGVIVEAWGDGYCGEFLPVDPPGLLLARQ